MSSNFCSSCGKPLAENDTFCPNCGHCTNFTVNQSGSVLKALPVTKDRPEGLDWLVIALIVWALYESLSAVFSFSFFYGGLLTALILYKRELFINALCHRNIFKPFMVHLAWGIVVYESSIFLFMKAMSAHSIHSLFYTYFALSFLYLLVNAIYYAGYRIICKHYKNSEPQGQLIRAFVTLGLLLLYLAVRGHKLDPIPTFADSSLAATGPVPDITPFSDATIDSVNTINQQAMPLTANTQLQPDTVMSPADTTLNITDSLSQSAGSVDIHTDGSVDLFDANSQITGHITPTGAILDALNMPSGQIHGNAIFDANNQVAYTIEGDTIFDKLHQPSFTIRDDQIFDKLNQVVGSIK